MIGLDDSECNNNKFNQQQSGQVSMRDMFTVFNPLQLLYFQIPRKLMRQVHPLTCMYSFQSKTMSGPLCSTFFSLIQMKDLRLEL